MEDTDFDLLAEGLPPEQAKRMRKILVEWCDGDEAGFPVQMAMLTRAQWLMAASVPRSVNDSRKLMEAHSAEHLRQFKALLPEFAGIARKNSDELKAIVSTHAQATKEAASALRVQLLAAETVADQIRDKLDSAVKQWERAKNALADERLKFEQVCTELDERLQWQSILWFLLGAVLVFALGITVGHFGWKP